MSNLSGNVTNKQALNGSMIARGADGKSAYQYALDGGYTGTEAEFAAKLAEENPAQEEFEQLSETIADKATLANGVIKFYKTGETDKELFSVDVSNIGGTGGLDLNNLTLSVSQVGAYQRLSMSDGTTTKTVDIPIATISDAQVQTAVETWLDAHPEAVTTVQDGSITEQKLDDGAVTPLKTGFITFDGYSENLFNKETVTDGYRLDLYNALKATDGFSISDYIPVEGNTTYAHKYPVAKRYQAFDASKTFISADWTYGTFTTPENCAYIRIDLASDEKDVLMVVKGTTLPSEYIPYEENYILGDSIKIKVSNVNDLREFFANIPNNIIEEEMLSEELQNDIDTIANQIKVGSYWNNPRKDKKTLTGRINIFENASKGLFEITSDISDKTIVVHGVNYFDINDMVWGQCVNGVVSGSTTNMINEHLIPIQPGKQLYFNRNEDGTSYSYLIFVFYNADGEWTRNHTIGGKTPANIIPVNDDEYFMRVSCVNVIDLNAEKLCVADVNIGNTLYGYSDDGGMSIGGASGSSLYFDKVLYMPYIGYRIENGALIGSSDLFAVEEILHVDVFEADKTIEVSAYIEDFNQDKLKNVQLKYGRHADTDYVIARIFKNTIDGNTITPIVLANTPGGKTMATIIKEMNFVMAVNAGIFDMTDNSCLGTTISDGVVITDHVDSTTCGLSDTLCIDKRGDFVSYPYSTTTEHMLSSGVIQAVQGWCTIIENYKKTDLNTKTEEVSLPTETNTVLTGKHPRTAIGQFKNGDYMVFTCGGRETNQEGMTCAEMQDLFVNEGLKYAYNLDGGGSCNMMFYKKELAPFTELRANPTYIVFN